MTTHESGVPAAPAPVDPRDLWFAEWQLVLPRDAREAWPGWQRADGVAAAPAPAAAPLVARPGDRERIERAWCEFVQRAGIEGSEAHAEAFILAVLQMLTDGVRASDAPKSKCEERGGCFGGDCCLK